MMRDIFEKILEDPAMKRVEAAKAAHLYPYFRALSESQATVAQFEGREVVMLGSNNYLGLSVDPRVKQAAADAIECYGTSVTGSRFLNGTLDLHLELERRLADFVHKPAALVFTTGYQTILGTISALVGRGDVLVLDREAHACAVDGGLLSQGQIKRFRHNDPAHLGEVLKSLPASAGKLVVVDGVYSMSGDITPLPEIIGVCQQYKARLLVDDAHGLGVLGDGHGTAHHSGCSASVDLIMGTFSKSFASIGGFIAGDEAVIRYIQHKARAFIFSAALPPASAAVVSKALDILETEPEIVSRVHHNADVLRKGLLELGYRVEPGQTPIIPVQLAGDDLHVFTLWESLIQNGVYVNPVVPPATPAGTGLLRISVTAAHEAHHLERALAAFAVAREQDGAEAY